LSYFGVVLGASPLEQSILTSVRNLGSNIFQSIWGWLADLKGRKLVLTIGFSTLAIVMLFAPFSQNPMQLVIISIILTSIGFSVIPAWNAFLGDYAFERVRASFIGRINSIGTLASIFLIFILGILMDVSPFPFPQVFRDGSNNYSSTRPVFFIPFFASALIFGFTIVISFFLVEKYEAKKRSAIEEELRMNWRILIRRNEPFRRLLPIDAFFKFAMSTAWPIFPFVTLRVADSWSMVAFMWIVFHLPRSIGQNYGGRFADKYGKKVVIILSRLGYAIVPLGYAMGLVTGNPWFLIAVNMPGGLAFGAEDTSIAAYSLDCSTEDTKGRYYSILLTVGGLCAFAGSLASGFIMDVWLRISGVDYDSPSFNTILFGMLMIITALRLISGSLHKLIYSNPLDFDLESLRD
ncbi:MAG: MFS transporter, partial [Candidatus Hodarchaeales archaeon]